MTIRMGAVCAVLLLCSTLLAPTAVVAQAGAPAATPGKYEGTTLDEGQPTETEFVEFRVSRNGKKVQGFRARLGMYCYVGAPLYNQIIPTVVEAPTLRVKKGKVSRGWTEVYEVDGVPYTLTGRLVMKFKGGRLASGKVAVEFDSCGTTTGTPAGYIHFEARRG